jgi:UDP-N-acetylmuramoyl-tripeptide--D-alanyl-D-alanine ligase
MMSAMTLSQVAQAMSLTAQGDAEFLQVCSDTRSIQSGDLFVALSGEHFDGNQFVAEAVNKGAVAAVVNQPPETEVPYLQVEDTRLALGLVARYNRRQFNKPLVALTGSAGKTTTKEMLAAILSEAGSTLSTDANLNNEIGVPQTLLRISQEHQFAVIEMGAARSGDIAYLCQFAEPTIGMVTNAMSAHMEGFGSLENVAKTKGEIFEGVAADGVAIINLDSSFAQQWKEQSGNRKTITFGLENEQADVRACSMQVVAGQGTRFTLCCSLGEVDVQLSLLGRHNVGNALAATAAAIAAGASLEQIQRGLNKVKAVAGRLHCLQADAGFTLIDDSYNANPGAVKAAIDVLADCKGQRCLVLGAMAELGDQAADLHREVGAYAKEKAIDQLMAVGEFADQVIAGFGSAGASFTTVEQLLSQKNRLENTDVMLVKGSRSAKMERVVQAFCDGNGGNG